MDYADVGFDEDQDDDTEPGSDDWGDDTNLDDDWDDEMLESSIIGAQHEFGYNGDGAAIFISSFKNLEIINCTFIDNGLGPNSLGGVCCLH